MTKENQIEEMAKVLCGMKNGCDECMWDRVHCNERNYAEEIYNEGYRKQSEGEWKDRYENKYANHYYECSVCGKPALNRTVDNGLGNPQQEQALSPYCPHCGAKMGGKNG